MMRGGRFGSVVRRLAGVGAGLAAMLWAGGCATATMRPVAAALPAPAPSVMADSPVPEEVSPRDTWVLAEAFAEAHGNCETMVGSGGSMLPLYRDRTVLVVQRRPLGELRRGMTVVFFGDSGRMVAHTLVAETPQGWIAQGLANAERDRTVVRERNYIGTVIKAFAPNPTIASVRVRVLPVMTSGPTVAMRGNRPSPDTLLALAPPTAE